MALRILLAGRRSAVVAAVLFAVVCLSVRVAAGPPVPVPHLRFVDTRLAPIVREGCRRSPTFRALVDQLEQSDVVVYLETVSAAPPQTMAYLRWSGATATLRLVRVAVKIPASTDKIIALIGHELQHANELANAHEVRGEPALAAFYRRVGDTTPGGVDTAAARLVGDAVRYELGHASPLPAVVNAADVAVPSSMSRQ